MRMASCAWAAWTDRRALSFREAGGLRRRGRCPLIAVIRGQAGRPRPALVGPTAVRCRRSVSKPDSRAASSADRGTASDPERRHPAFRSLMIALEGQSHGEICFAGAGDRRPVRRPSSWHRRACEDRRKTLHPSARGSARIAAAETASTHREEDHAVHWPDRQRVPHAPGKICGVLMVQGGVERAP